MYSFFNILNIFHQKSHLGLEHEELWHGGITDSVIGLACLSIFKLCLFPKMIRDEKIKHADFYSINN